MSCSDATGRRARLAEWTTSARPERPRQELSVNPITEQWLLAPPRPLNTDGTGADGANGSAWETSPAPWTRETPDAAAPALALMNRVVTQMLTVHAPDTTAAPLDPRLAYCLDSARTWRVGTAPGEGLLCLRRSLVNLVAPV